MFPEINNHVKTYKISKKNDKNPKYSNSPINTSSFNITEQCQIHPGCIWSMDCTCTNCKKINLLYDTAN